MNLKNLICTGVGLIGGFISHVFGGWSPALTTLVILMICDYMTGIAAAAFFHKSNKSATGGLDSRAGWKGIVKKIITLLFVLVAYRLDLVLYTNYIKNTVIFAFIANEVISLVENAGLIGIPMPSVIIKAIDVLKGKDHENN